ncbi:MAG TPA: helix-turn-helix transcriptional regulator [Candidatus Binataceae bacterium]|nr:helix-turn-helix transcriptional regulator [Candidatus Binataceae bacterium]
MKKKTLGQVLKQQREAFALTQRELARKIGVKASHVAYLENGRRRPSLSLISRIADTLGLDKQQIFLLAHPEAKALVSAQREPSEPDRRDQVWRRFTTNRALLTRNHVTPRELRVLQKVNLLGRVSSPRQYLFILNSIRQAVEEEE